MNKRSNQHRRKILGWRFISQVLGKRNNFNITKVVASEGNLLVNKITKENIEEAIIGGFCNHFNQTNHTTLRIDIMVEHIGIMVEKTQYQRIL